MASHLNDRRRYAGEGVFKGIVRDLAAAEAQQLENATMNGSEHPPSPDDLAGWEKYTVCIGTDHGFVAGRMKDGRPHLSLAGVLPLARGHGVFSGLVSEFAHRMGADKFSVSTYEGRYPTMAAWIRKHMVEELFHGPDDPNDRFPGEMKLVAVVKPK